MKIRIENGLPIVSLRIEYQDKKIELNNVLIDTGSSNTIIDADLAGEVGIEIDPFKGKAKRMYGVGGESELCYEQPVSRLTIDANVLEGFRLQLGITRETYGFDAILGSDYFIAQKSIIDYKTYSIK
ncbi:hypothetical protein BHU72_10720 [Desulfuribacillus stibiiarsenatis]|uniref:Peptidase A2 domain-containing protein n=1 Tax=Desulfuribacillus stibiiarsenatis TaxID=1390249 RepID=A0A1E5L2W5_9FIRM|nr:retropepsin-like aspartic protease [Desulfuribacillus stibiiarsenatis]OEH84279.1 hypothetical protein BHU72_10720 [Desulfuribacillus stibiiarsenatis]